LYDSARFMTGFCADLNAVGVSAFAFKKEKKINRNF
jgi:hypothetical protein